MRHLIDFGDLPRHEWDALYARASQIMDDPSQFVDVCKGRVSCNLFYEPSTRTNFSFQTAMLRLGGTVFGFADPNSSSAPLGRARPRPPPSTPPSPWSMPATAATCTPPRPWPI